MTEPNTQVSFGSSEELDWDRGAEGYEQVYADGKMPDIEMAKMTGFGPLFKHIRDQLVDQFGIDLCELTDDEIMELINLKTDFFNTHEPLSPQATQRFLNMPRDHSPLEQWAGTSLPPDVALGWGPGPKFYERFVRFEKKMQKRFERLRHRHKGMQAGTEQSRKMDLAPSDKFNPETSGVDKPENDGNKTVWQRITPHPRGRHAYLRNFVGVDFDSATAAYRGRDALALAGFAEDGAERARGVIKTTVPDVDSLPVPVGGRIEKTKKRLLSKGYKVDYRVNDEEPEDVARIKSMRLSAFRAAAASMYGAELYAALTHTVGIDDLPESVRGEWRALIERLSHTNVTVGAAIALIQAHVVEHPRIKYHRYTGNPIKEEIFQEFKARAAKGEARGTDEHLSLALMLGGGVCVEMAKITMTLMRMAGIPTVFSTGYKAKHGEVTSAGHAWAEAVFPQGKGQWYGEPVESSTVYLTDDMTHTMKQLLKKFPKKSHPDEVHPADEIAEETPIETTDQPAEAAPSDAAVEEVALAAVAAPLIKIAATHPDMPREVAQVLEHTASALQRADAETRTRIAHWLGALPALMDLKDKNFMESNAAELMLRNWRVHLGGSYGGPTDPEAIARAATQASEDPRSRALLLQWAAQLNELIENY